MKERKLAQIRAANARRRAEKRAKGMVPKEIWVYPDDWEDIKKTINRCNNVREGIVYPDDAAA